MKIKNNMFFMIAIYSVVIIGCAYVFLYQPNAKVNYIYNQF